VGEKRGHLPVFGGLIDPGKPTPSLDEARDHLGGPWVGGPDIGAVVRVPAAIGELTGVVVHSTPSERDVWIGAGRIQRVPAASAVLADADASHDALVADAEVYAALVVGQRVRYERPDGSSGEGAIAEKLRYGALVGTDDGRVLAVSLRRITPLVTEDAT